MRSAPLLIRLTLTVMHALLCLLPGQTLRPYEFCAQFNVFDYARGYNV